MTEAGTDSAISPISSKKKAMKEYLNKDSYILRLLFWQGKMHFVCNTVSWCRLCKMLQQNEISYFPLWIQTPFAAASFTLFSFLKERLCLWEHHGICLSSISTFKQADRFLLHFFLQLHHGGRTNLWGGRVLYGSRSLKSMKLLLR